MHIPPSQKHTVHCIELGILRAVAYLSSLHIYPYLSSLHAQESCKMPKKKASTWRYPSTKARYQFKPFHIHFLNGASLINVSNLSSVSTTHFSDNISQHWTKLLVFILRTQCHWCFCEKIEGSAWRSGCPGKMRLSCNCLESQVVGQAMLQQLEKRIQRKERKEVHIACNNFIWFWWKTQLKRSAERKQLHFYGIFKFCICHIKRLNKVKLRENSDIEKGKWRLDNVDFLAFLSHQHILSAFGLFFLFLFG